MYLIKKRLKRHEHFFFIDGIARCKFYQLSEIKYSVFEHVNWNLVFNRQKEVFNHQFKISENFHELISNNLFPMLFSFSV